VRSDRHAQQLIPEREHGCCGGLNWRVDLPAEADPALVAHRLVRMGYTARCEMPSLKVVRHPDGHEIAIVPRSGRVQLRVYMLTPVADRERVATELAADLLACLA